MTIKEPKGTQKNRAESGRAMSSADAAEYLGLSESTLRQSRMDGRRENRIPPPPFVKVGKKILYLRDDLDTWLESHRHNSQVA